jgi:hypothetical protein
MVGEIHGRISECFDLSRLLTPRFGTGSTVLLHPKPERSGLAHGALVCGVHGAAVI